MGVWGLGLLLFSAFLAQKRGLGLGFLRFWHKKKGFGLFFLRFWHKKKGFGLLLSAFLALKKGLGCCFLRSSIGEVAAAASRIWQKTKGVLGFGFWVVVFCVSGTKKGFGFFFLRSWHTKKGFGLLLSAFLHCRGSRSSFSNLAENKRGLGLLLFSAFLAPKKGFGLFFSAFLAQKKGFGFGLFFSAFLA